MLNQDPESKTRFASDYTPGMYEHGPLRIEVFTEPMFAENGYLLWCEGRPECWVIDPGFPPAPDEIADAIQEYELKPTAIVLTHAHVDHIAGIEPLRSALDSPPLWCPRGESELLARPEQNLSVFMGAAVVVPPAQRLLSVGEPLRLGELSWEVRDVAGHSPGGLAYCCASVGVAICGDAVFAASIGRYDFPHSSRDRLLRNIRENVLTLPADTMIYSGHGPRATIADIRAYNEVLRWELSQFRG
jgi:glyoxylase-like metal-dependent hydrolase (beta-lactamase superfamily II)